MKKCILAALIAFCLNVSARDQDVREAIVKIYSIHSQPDYYNPWSMMGPRGSTGSGCIIKGRKILTNAHVVSDQTFIQVRRYSDSKRHQARVVSVSHMADLAILTVDDPAFFEGVEPLELGKLPEPQKEVVVYGFPLGGDTMSTTKGVVSRIEHQRYVHSSVYLLAGQIDAAINPGNSGGPVLMGDQVVGVVMQSISDADNIGYMVPVSIVKHFMKDLEDGRNDGFPGLGVVLQDMENPDLKRMYKQPENESGVLIVKVLPGSVAEGHLKPGDVLVSIEGNRVADDGTVEFRPKERTSVSYYIQNHQIGETMKLEILRDGKKMPMTVTLNNSLTKDWLIPMESYDTLPSYYIYGGVVFCPLTKNLLKAWGPSWYGSAPKSWVSLVSNNYASDEIDEVVIALKVLAADVNEGYHKFTNWTVDKVNGEKVKNMKDLVAKIEGNKTDPFVVISNDIDQRIVLDRKRVAESRARILQTYRIQSDRSDDLKDL